MPQPIQKITLPNGLRTLLIPRAASLASTVLVLVEAGSEYETKGTNGLSHFLEHLMFKGTVNRPRANMIAEELDALGADYNAFTGEEFTGYWAKAENHKLPQIIDLISDIYLNPVFDAPEIEKERGVIIEEINMYEDNPSDYAHRIFGELLYGDQPAGWKTEGTKEVVRKLTRDDFVKYRGIHYVAPKTVVVIAGAFDEKKALDQVNSLFGSLPNAPVVSKPKTNDSARGPAVKIFKKDSAQSHLVLGVRAFPIGDERRRSIKVLSNILGGGMSSRLWRRIREELGAAYYVGSHADLLLDHGNFTVSAGIDHSKMATVLRSALDEMKQIATVLVPPQELQKAKDHMVGNFIMGLETSDELANYFGSQEVLTMNPQAPEEVISQINAVTREEIRAVAAALFREDQLHLAVVGPNDKEDELLKLLSL
ncbi:MAG: pitrilysin family protein [Candidatus Liptonbacteria bacterium]